MLKEKLLPPDLVREYTEEQIEELIKCKNDIEYFTKKYVKIQHPIYGYVKMNPWDFQLEFLNILQNKRLSIALWSRQSGKSTCVAIYAIWLSIFNSHKTIGIVSNLSNSAKTILKRMKYIYLGLPDFLKPGVREWAKTHVEFDNDSAIFCGSTTEDSLSGESLSVLICDEFAKVRPSIAREFWSANFPTISTGGQVIVISTPKGIGNLFHHLWVGALNETNDFYPFKVEYWQVPGRDENWAEEEKRNIGKRQFSQEYGLQFLGSTNTLIEGEILEKISTKQYEPIEVKDREHTRIYSKPKPGHIYVFGIDIGKGLGQNDSVIQCIDITNYPEEIEQVFVYSSNEISLFDFPEVIYRYGIYYNNAYIMAENNAEGYSVLKQLWFELEYENLVNVGTQDKTTGLKKFDLGIRSTSATKPTANIWLKKLIENNILKIKDQITIEQLCDYIEDNGRFYGESGKDDHISALVWAVYFLRTNFAEDLEFLQRRAKKIQQSTNNEIEEDDDIWGFFTDSEYIDNIEEEKRKFQRELANS